MAQLLDSRSSLASKTELDLFQLPPTQVAIDNGWFQEVHLKNTLTSTGPYEFEITADNAFTDMSRNYIFMVISVTRKNGAAIAAATAPAGGGDVDYKYSIINMLGKTFFRQVKLWIGGKLIYDSGDTYHYRSYLETLLNYSNSAKETHLQAAGYYMDTAGEMDSKDGSGFRSRAVKIDGGKKIELLAPLHGELFNQERLMLSNLPMRLELHRNPDNLVLMAPDGTDFKLKVHDMSFFIRRVEPLKSLALGLETHLTKEPAKYPVRRVLMRVIQIEAGRKDLQPTQISSGQLPRRVIFGLVDQDAYHGTLKKNPLAFKHHNLKEYKVIAGGLSFPRDNITMDYANDLYTKAFLQMFEALNITGGDRSNGIDYHAFGNGFCIYGVDLSPDGFDGGHWQLLKTGSAHLKLEFDTETTASLKVILFIEYDNLIEVTRHRMISHDFEI